MCGRYELTTKFKELPSLLKKNFPAGLNKKYAQQELIKPFDPVLVLINEGKITTSIMLWGFISQWAKNPFDKEKSRPFNARVETVEKKKLFKGSWRHKRCLIPANGFFEKGHRITRKDKQPFWLGGIWNRWMSHEGSELNSCCILTTQANELIEPLHHRMPVVITNGLEEEWIAAITDVQDLNRLKMISGKWNPEEWKAESINKKQTNQLSLF